MIVSRGGFILNHFRTTALYLHSTQSISVFLSFVHSFCHPNEPPHTPPSYVLVGVWCASAKPSDTQPSALLLSWIIFLASNSLSSLICCLVHLTHDTLNDWVIGSFTSILQEPPSRNEQKKWSWVMSAGDDHLIPSVEVTGKGKWIMKLIKNDD